jgi:uncharacterized protein (DUF608 family)
MGVLIMGMHIEDRYYEPDDPEDDEFDEQLAELLNGDYSPDLEENIKEAFMNDAFFGDHWATLVEALQNNEKEKIGLIISTCIYEYWENSAERAIHA